MHTVFISTGSNLGNRGNFLSKAEEEITVHAGSILAASHIIETPPWGNTEQPAFLNQVLKIKTRFPPLFLMESLLDIEKAMGRNRTEKWGPRIIDIDILFFNNRIINQEDLCIPHPHLHEREFVLKPMVEIAPDFVHPVFQKTMSELLQELNNA
ncbi:MAG: 2-amino-4-hydroxy-6-hydroxymethyldihydropteridine diphosphokinase [Sphingomonadales bacterium]|nr:2-amino-4-hydroxy-6-hydroxymethyldihydropteridine diphosphokinase [Sphingomonadales bacterium]